MLQRGTGIYNLKNYGSGLRYYPGRYRDLSSPFPAAQLDGLR